MNSLRRSARKASYGRCTGSDAAAGLL